MRDVVRAILTDGGLNQAELAERIGVTQPTVSRWLSGKQKPEREQWMAIEKVADAIGITHGPLTKRTTPVVGYVGAGAEAHLYAEAQGPFDEVASPEGATDETVAVEIRGESLGSFFDQWLVFYDDVRRPMTSDLLGKLCVVGLPDERILIKKIQRSKSLDGHYNLLSQFEPPIYDVQIEWAAKVKNMVPR